MIRALILAAAFGLAAPPLAAAVPAQCKSVTGMADLLAEYGEFHHWVGYSGVAGREGILIGLFTAPDGAWSMVESDGDIACLIDFGPGWSEPGKNEVAG